MKSKRSGISDYIRIKKEVLKTDAEIIAQVIKDVIDTYRGGKEVIKRGTNTKIDSIYFVQNLHGIQYFLSLYKPGEQNLVVMSDNKSLQQFLQEIMPTGNKIVVPQIPGYLPRVGRPFFILFWRILYARLLKGIKPSAKVYFFSKGGVHFAILLGYLAKRGVDVRYVDAVSANYPLDQIEAQHLLSRHYLRLLCSIAGIRLVKYQDHFGQFLGVANCGEPMRYRPDSWELLSKKYQWSYKNETKNAVLIVNAPIQRYRGIDIKRTQQNLVRYFSPLLNNGIQIHLKPHYNAPGINCFSGTSLENEIEILPAYFPVELIMFLYPEVYYFCSASGFIPIEGKKYSLLNLVVFNSNEEQDFYWKLCKDDFDEEITKVEFIEIKNIIN